MNNKYLLKGFKRPREILKSSEQSGKTAGRFIIEPLERGFGLTVGNALRRTMLASLPGYAVTAVKIESVLHEFTTVKGVVEDVTEILLNLKQLIIVLHNDLESKIIEISKKGEGEFTGRDLTVDNDITILNPDFKIATLSSDANLKMRIQIEIGRGYVPAEAIKERIDEVAVIPVDAIFTPVRKVSFKIEDLRIGNRSDYEKLIIEIETNGTITAEEAVGSASKILKETFARFIHFKDQDEEDEDFILEEQRQKNESKTEKILSMPVEDLELSVRSLHCLQTAGAKTIGDLVHRDETELMKSKNFGKKSLDEISEKLEKLGLHFGMSDNDIQKIVETN